LAVKGSGNGQSGGFLNPLKLLCFCRRWLAEKGLAATGRKHELGKPARPFLVEGYFTRSRSLEEKSRMVKGCGGQKKEHLEVLKQTRKDGSLGGIENR